MTFCRNEFEEIHLTLAELILKPENRLSRIDSLDSELRYELRYHRPQDVKYNR